MSAVIPVPTLSTQGFVSDSVGKMDYLLAHFFLADYNQTYLYQGQVISLPRIIEKSGSDAMALLSDLKQSLISYLSGYYDSVEVEAKPAVPFSENFDVRFTIELSIGVYEQGSQAIYGRLLESRDSKMDKILKLTSI